MISIFHKPSTITIDAFTNNSAHYELFQMEKSSKNIPTWLKETPSEAYGDSEYGIRVPIPTMKRCDSIMRSFKNAYDVRSQFEILVRSEEDTVYYHMPYSDPDAVTLFSPHQKPFFNLPHFKINSTWYLREKDGVEFMLGDAYWHNYDEPWRVVPGILNFKYQGAVHVNVSIPPNTPQFGIDAGQSIAQLIPLSDKKVEIKHHLVSTEEWNRLRDVSGVRHSFVGKYSKNKKMRKF